MRTPKFEIGQIAYVPHLNQKGWGVVPYKVVGTIHKKRQEFINKKEIIIETLTYILANVRGYQTRFEISDELLLYKSEKEYDDIINLYLKNEEEAGND